MAHINLLPPELKKETEKKVSASRNRIPLEIIVGSVGGSLVIILVLHFMLMVLGFHRLTVYKNFEKQWKTMESRRSIIEGIITELDSLKAEEGDMNKIFSQTFHEWSPTLNFLSLDLPKGVWFTQMTVAKADLTLAGSVVPRGKDDEMVLVHSYANQFKTDEFLKVKFYDFVLDSVKTHKVQSVDVADFLITTKIRSVDQERQPRKAVEPK